MTAQNLQHTGQGPELASHARGQSLRRAAVALALLAGLVATGCSFTGNNAARRMEGAEAVQLTQGEPKALPLRTVSAANADVTEMEVVWVDESRTRAIPAHVFLPARPGPGNAAGPAPTQPMVIFSHGLGGSRLSYSQIGRHWASQGFVSVHVQHAGSDRAIWTASGLAILGALKTAASTENAIARARDVSFVIDQVAKEPLLAAAVDFERIAIAGHSFGANTALLSAGAQFKVNGKLVSFGDPRIRAAIIMSPPSVPADQDPIYVYNPIQIPTLHLTGTRDDTPIPGLSTMAAQRTEAFDAMVATPRYLAIYEGGRHSMFHDRTADQTSVQIKNATKQISTLFLRAVLMADAQAGQALDAALKAQTIIARSEAKPAR